MDMEKDKDRFLLQLADDLSFEELQDLCYSKDANQFYSARLADWFVDKINYGWRLWQAAKAQAVSEVITIGNELQSWVAVWSFSAKNDGEDYVVVDANLLAEKIEKLTGANA